MRDIDKLLLFVTGHGQPAIMEALLDEGADANTRDELGRTPLHIIVIVAGRARGRSRERFRRAIKILLCHGAELGLEDVHGHSAPALAHH